MIRAGILVIVAGSLACCAAPPDKAPAAVPPRFLSPPAAKAKLEAGGVVSIDVRSPREFATGRLPGAVLIPLGSNGFEEKVRKAAGDNEVLIYCRSGRRSRIALKELAGIPGLLHLDGGINAWKVFNGPVEKPVAPAAPQRAPDPVR